MLLKKYFEKLFQCNNIIEALYLSKIVRKLCGISIFVLEVPPDNRIVKKFTLLGFSCFLLWVFLYFYSTYMAHTEDQAILRKLYSTKVQRYGDDVEGVTSSIYVIFALWKVPYDLSSNVGLAQLIVNVDIALENLGVKIDYNRDGRTAFKITISQLLIFVFRFSSIWITLSFTQMPVPVEKLFQVMYSDALVLLSAAHFCYYLKVLKSRFQYINKLLEQIHSQNCLENKIFVRSQMAPNAQKAVGLQGRNICEKIRDCAKVYAMLYKLTEDINKMFGVMSVLATFVCTTYITLYMFYFMEATAAGLFHDVPRYIAFLMYIFWQIGYNIVVLYVIAYFCECAIHEAKNTQFITHQIINSDISPPVTAEALQLSIQLLHQKPIFTASGLYKLNYAYLHETLRVVVTYLVILLQFVTDQN